MEARFKEFPKDKQRVAAVVQAIRKTNVLLPVFIEFWDATNFVIDGRHRMIAFKNLGIEIVPVVYCKDMRKLK